MNDGDYIYKPIRKTPQEPIEINDNFATLESRLRNENLNPKYKFYAYGVDET